MKRWWRTCFALLMLVQMVLMPAQAAAIDLASARLDAAALPPGTTALYPSPNERFGFGILRNMNDYELAPLSAGWYQNWSHYANLPHPNSISAAYVVRTSPEGLRLTLPAVELIAAEEPGALWLIGNEPDMIKQDNITPAEYAAQYHEAYFAIKARDPSARVAAGGIVQPSPLRLGWLSSVWDTYRSLYGHDMPVDVWNIHNYILPEKAGDWGADLPPGYTGERGQSYTLNDHGSLTIFQQHVLAMRAWMADHGERDKPLIISEYGILFPEYTGYDLQRVSDFFTTTADWMLVASDPELGYAADANHLVQSWLWYSLDDVSFNNEGNTIAALMRPDTHDLTPMGVRFAAYVSPLRRPYVNLVASRAIIRALDGAPISSAKVQVVAVSAKIRNLGNTPVTRPFRVTIETPAGNRLFDQMVDGMPARYGGNVSLTLNWQKPAGFEWELIVRVDPEDAIAESVENDNSATVTLSGDLRASELAVEGQRGTTQVVTRPGVKSLQLAVTVENSSSFRVNDAVVRFWDGGSLINQQSVSDLAANGQVELSFTWPNPPSGQHDLMAEVVAPTGVVDTISANNRQMRNLLVAASRAYFPAVPLYPGTQAAGGMPICRTDAVRNGGFETGDFTGWQTTPYVALVDNSCYEGQRSAYLGRILGQEESLSQTISIPADVSSAHLSYGWAIRTQEPAPAGRDTLSIELRTPAGQLLRVLELLDDRDEQPVWYGTSTNVSEYAGREVVLHFRSRNDVAYNTFFFLDKVVLETCQRQ